MKKSLIGLIVIGLLVVFFGKFHLGDALALFLLAGVVPGTSITLSATQVMAGCALVIGFILARVITPGVRYLVQFILRKMIHPTIQTREV